MVNKCYFPNCDRLSRCKGLCSTHYRQKRRGKELSEIKLKNKKQRKWNTDPIIEWDSVICNIEGIEDNCHIFRGYKDRDGYARVSIKGKKVSVHRYMWKKEYGTIPKGMVIDHKCRNKDCCNIKHLRVVTHKINSRENIQGASWQLNKAKTHCKHGHEYSIKNTYVYNGKRHCRECIKIAKRKNK